MRGASALGALLAEHKGADVRVLVIWEPVLPSDRGPPSEEVRAPLQDARVIEYWDEHRWMSPLVMQRAALIARATGTPEPQPGAIAWDFIALYPAGVRWEDPFPTPTWHGEPVIDSLEPVAEALRSK